jgi:hypothetical protein
MNGNGYSVDDSDAGEYGGTPAPVSIPSNGGFFGSLSQAAQQFGARFVEAPTSTQNSVGGALYNAIYAFGAGKIDLARETAARALLNSRTGSRFVGEVEQQRIMARLPVILAGAAVLFALVFMLARR